MSLQVLNIPLHLLNAAMAVISSAGTVPILSCNADFNNTNSDITILQQYYLPKFQISF
jgi:hypothetical protein